VIGYYIHHHGRGHLNRATAIARALNEPVTGLSSLDRPDAWPGEWVQLPLDTDAGTDAEANTGLRDPTAQGRLHWVPLGVGGVRDRAAAISHWIAVQRPSVVVVDVSVEVALLARLDGVPVVTFALPGDRTDDAHTLGFDVATLALGAWPAEASMMCPQVSSDIEQKLVPAGAIGRFAPAQSSEARARSPRRALVIGGAGGDEITAEHISAAARQTPGWSWEHLGTSGTWVSDVWHHLQRAAVVITHAGQGALADVSAARIPAIILPQDRPHGEQRAAAAALRDGDWPVTVIDEWPRAGWMELLEHALSLDGHMWSAWNDGQGASRAASEILRVAAGGRR
jgi:hypothetical protein